MYHGMSQHNVMKYVLTKHSHDTTKSSLDSPNTKSSDYFCQNDRNHVTFVAAICCESLRFGFRSADTFMLNLRIDK